MAWLQWNKCGDDIIIANNFVINAILLSKRYKEYVLINSESNT